MTALYTNNLNHPTTSHRQNSGRERSCSRSVHNSCTRSRNHTFRVLRKGLISAALIFALLIIISISVSRIFISEASIVDANQMIGEIQYKVVEIQKGDTLWTIAKDNIGPGYSDVYAYIRDIRECNQLKTNDITSGSYLMIPYYDTASVDYASTD